MQIQPKLMSYEIFTELFKNDNQDTIMAILKIRMQIEYLLRRILGKRLNIDESSQDVKFMSVLSLTKEFLKLYPQYMYLQKSFAYVREVGNAAAHAQQVSEFQAQDTLDIGTQLIATLKSIAQREGVI